MKFLKSVQQIEEVLTPLTRPGHALCRRSELARRCGITDDKVGHILGDLEQAFGPVVDYRGHRLELVGCGPEILGLVKKAVALAKGARDDEPAVILRAAVDDVPPCLLATAAEIFLPQWGGGAVALQFVSSDHENLASLIRAGHIAIAVGLEGDPVVGDGEKQEPGCRWMASAPDHMSITTAGGMVALGELAKHRLVLPSIAVRSPRLTELLAVTPLGQQVHVDSTNAALAMAGAGLGVAVTLEPGNWAKTTSNSLRHLPIAGAEPQRICLSYPRKAESLSQPALDLIEAIRAAVRTMALPPIPESPSDPTEIESLPELPEPLSA